MFLDNAPLTAMILGAALSGGDAMKLAEQLAAALEKENDIVTPSNPIRQQNPQRRQTQVQR